MSRIYAVCLLFLMSGPLGAQGPSVRALIDIDSDWGYTESDATAPQALDTPATRWQSVTLPHTWNALDATDETPGYRRGAGWYRRTLNLDSYHSGRRFVLYFEGANTVADVFVNHARAGGHVGGYVGFEVDITPFIRHGNNDVRVRVDNSDDPDLIPSDRSDFVIFGGLTRDVWLEVLSPVSLAHLEATTPIVTRDSARSHLLVEIANPEKRRGSYTVTASLRAPNGTEVASGQTSVAITGELTRALTMDLPTVRSPLLWGPGHPSLYNLVVSLTSGDGTIDRVEQRVGFRWYRFEPNGPFYLNGERLLLRGTQLHEDFAGLGAAIPNERHRRDLEMISEMGANFVRLAHYPQDPEVYRTADSLGLLVWDELPWDRGGVGGDRWRANTRRLLEEQVRQNISHPSIILWSLGNEVSFIIETFNRGDTASVRGFMRELKSLAHSLDPARPTAVRQIDEVADIVDVYAPSIWAGWYRGVYADYEKALLDAHSKYPRMLHMEYGADGHYGRHSENPINGAGMRLESGYAESVGTPVANIARNGDWSESYQTDLLDWHLMVTEHQAWLAGTAQWIFRDFPTPLRPENPIPYVNQKGLFTRDGKPKDAYYVYRAYWTTSPKFVYIVSHTWTERSGAAGKPVTIRAYSNCASVDLSVNGKSQGAKPRVTSDFPSQGLRWDVSLTEGRNSVVAVCAGADASVRDSIDFNYTTAVAGRPSRIVLGTKQLPNGHLLIEARLLDSNGRQSLGAADRLYFNSQGAGRLMVDLGTPTGSSVIQAANGYAAIEFVPPPAGKRAMIVARTQEINGARLDLVGSSVVPAEAKP
jgi:beta-galactosidase